MISPLHEPQLFRLGPIPFGGSMLTSIGITLVLGLGSIVGSRFLRAEPGKFPAIIEVIVTTILEQIEEVTRKDGRPYLPLVGSLFLFLIVANSLSLLPGLQPPTERLETVIALGMVVFVSVYYFGIRRHGLWAYLKHFFQPTPLLFPIHVLSELTRTFSLMMRLFGNIMSHGLILGVIVSVAGLLVPIPIILFGLLTGVVQAYIFTILATVYIAAAVEDHPKTAGHDQKETQGT
jgi:F-type H+-transporting ATPase subunit a